MLPYLILNLKTVLLTESPLPSEIKLMVASLVRRTIASVKVYATCMILMAGGTRVGVLKIVFIYKFFQRMIRLIDMYL
jgi:hypothetical protein